ncbi:MAG: amidohydrolase family protein [Spirochaetes bacterium]|nr:amidohydrolase family protein [Spirochaetota bacterium]
MIIDFHTHIFSPSVKNYRTEYFQDSTFSILYSHEKSRIIDHNDLIKAIDNANIDYAVAMGFPWEKADYCDEQNEYLKDAMSSSNNRIQAFGSLPVNDQSSIERNIKKIKDLGLAGIGEIAFYEGGLDKSESDILNLICSAAMKYSLPLCLHLNEPVGHIYKGKHRTSLNITYSVLQNFPDLTVILAHWGGGLLFYELMKEVKNSLKNIYYDTAASPFLYDDKIYKIAADITGADKILLGTDFPLINFNRYIDAINNSIESETDRKAIMGGNALKILKALSVQL